jgi:hypothetical protein
MPAETAPKKITDFLQTKRSKLELRTALAVLREFKECESMEEWLGISFSAWAKLEQLEEFLAHLVEGAPLLPDTLAYMEEGGSDAGAS